MALKTVSVEAKNLKGYTIESKARQHVALIDQPPAGGGVDAGPTPLEYLFISLAGCIVTIGLIKAHQEKLPVRNIEVKVEGELDTDVLMGKSTAVRPGFTDIRVVVKVDGDMTQAEKEKFIHEVDARCPISDNILNASPVKFVVS